MSRPWLSLEIRAAIDMRQSGFTTREIAAALGRGVGATAEMFVREGASFPRSAARRESGKLHKVRERMGWHVDRGWPAGVCGRTGPVLEVLEEVGEADRVLIAIRLGRKGSRGSTNWVVRAVHVAIREGWVASKEGPRRRALYRLSDQTKKYRDERSKIIRAREVGLE